MSGPEHETPAEPESKPDPAAGQDGGKSSATSPARKPRQLRKATAPATGGAEVTPKELAEALKLPVTVTPRRGDVPVLSNVRLGFGHELELIATDGDMQVSTSCPLPESSLEQGTVLVVSAARLAAVATAAGELERMRLEPRPNGLLVRHELERAVLALTSAEDFPLLPEPAGEPVAVTVEAEQLAAALARVRPAVARDQTRYYLQGVHAAIVVNRLTRLELTATDGNRLHHARIEGEISGARVKGERSVIIPDRVLSVLLEAEGEVTLRLYPTGLVAACDAWQLTARTIDGKYPDWRRVVPPDRAGIKVAANALLAAIDRVRGFLGGRKDLVLSLTGELLGLQAANPDRADVAETEVEGEPAGEPRALVAGFNARYLRDLVAIAAGEVVQLEWGDVPSAPLRVTFPTRPDDVGVLMPIAGADWRELNP